jgi:hypothetical protein
MLALAVFKIPLIRHVNGVDKEMMPALAVLKSR